MKRVWSSKKSVKEFKENLEKKKFSNLSVLNESLIEKENYIGNINSLISCSENIYEDLLKIYDVNEKILEINSDKYLKIAGSGILYLIINNDSNIFLDICAESFEGVFIKILVKEKIKFNLINQNKGENLFSNIKLIQEENSKVKHLMFNINNKQNVNEIILNQGANYKLEGINYLENNNLINLNDVNHIGNNSNSDFKINCYTFNKANISCKTKNKVESKINHCESHQKIHGLILSKDSKINCEPILEIFSNDVISSHSASVSKIFDETKYYLMSRGMSDRKINNFIVNERFNFLIEKIKVDEFKEKINF